MAVSKTSSAPSLANVSSQVELVDWGEVPTLIDGASHTSGVLIHKHADGSSECGLWVCTPGVWDCHVTRDEFCHFVAGRCRYEHESGELIDIEADTAAFFPAGWKGRCSVYETVRKLYMIR